jgi:O-antigen/teichoic acid export membrane protein
MYTLLVWVAIPVASLVSVFVNPLIAALYGDSYRSAADVLSVHIWTGVFVFLGVASGRWMLIEGLTRSFLNRYILGVTINVALNIVLIPRNGIVGAAYAALVAQMFVVFVYDLLDPRVRPSLVMKYRALVPLYLAKRS